MELSIETGLKEEFEVSAKNIFIITVNCFLVVLFISLFCSLFSSLYRHVPSIQLFLFHQFKKTHTSHSLNHFIHQHSPKARYRPTPTDKPSTNGREAPYALSAHEALATSEPGSQLRLRAPAEGRRASRRAHVQKLRLLIGPPLTASPAEWEGSRMDRRGGGWVGGIGNQMRMRCKETRTSSK